MNNEMAYLLGMIYGNGEINNAFGRTSISIEIPHKKLETEDFHNVKIYVKASVADISGILAPLIGSSLPFVQKESVTILSFSKPEEDYLVREILRYVGSAVTHNDMRLHDEIFGFTVDQKKMFLKGFCDVTGYIRRSNSFIDKYKHRVYIEVPNNWFIVIDICNLLKDLDIPVQSIDWAHPNMRDGRLKKYNQGHKHFWKKEHQIKIYANEFLPIGFGIIHKMQALQTYASELVEGFKARGIVTESVTHRFYWEVTGKIKNKDFHPCENDSTLPSLIMGRHYDSWKQIAKDLGYGK